MARMECKCGKLLSTVRVPNEIEYYVYSYFEWDDLLKDDFIEAIKIPPPKHQVWKCPDCERIYIFHNNKLIKTYKLDLD